MKVLYNSNKETDIVTCLHCNSVLEIESNDLFERNISLFVSMPSFKCPICGKTLPYTGKLTPWYEK